jgi:hypothetical protein
MEAVALTGEDVIGPGRIVRNVAAGLVSPAVLVAVI